MTRQLSLKDIWCKETIRHPIPIPATDTHKPARDVLSQFFIRRPTDYADPEYTRRLEEEYELIDSNRFTRVFIQVRVILDIIDDMGQRVPHIIRGSAGCSLVCFFMGITNIDPIYYKIELARFMNTGRKDIPDIDIDVPYNHREELYLRINRHWNGLVARISNHVKWGNITALRSSVIEILKAKQENGEDTRDLQRKARRRGFNANTLLPSAKDRKIAIDSASKLEGTMKHYSLHCGGIVIFEETGEVPENLILYPSERDKPLQIRLNKDETEDAGYIKIDILSNRGLAQLADITGELDLTRYPARSFAIEQIFSRGNTIGLTFGESRGMRRIFMEMSPKNIEDVATALALIRPGASMDGRKADYFRRRRAGMLDSTNLAEFSIIYDDDAIALIRKTLGCSSAEADEYRKAFAKSIQEKQDEMYIRGIKCRHSEATMDAITANLSNLRYYSFCKSHAMSYAQLVWALAYWKAVAPHRFWCATLNHCHSDYRRWVHYREARCSGLSLSLGRPPYKIEGTRLISVSDEPSPSLAGGEPLAKQIIREYRTYGYWTSTEFMPGCEIREVPYNGRDIKSIYRFIGLIATGRVINRSDMTATMITVGCANGYYIDIVLSGFKRGDLLHYSFLEGELTKKAPGTYEAIRVRGLSIAELSARL